MLRTMMAIAAAGLLGGSLVGGCGSNDAGSDFEDEDAGTSSSGGGGIGASSGGGIGASGGNGAGDGGSSSGSGPTCATANATTTRQPIYLQIILDGSGSMDGYANVTPNQASQCIANTYSDNTGAPDICKYTSATEPDPLVQGRRTGKKWLAARGALKAYFEAKGQVGSDQLGVGMLFFYSSNGSNQRYDEVPIALLDGAQAAALWDPIKPDRFPLGGTPILPSVEQSVEILEAFAPTGGLAADGRRAILLITDGVPTSGTGSTGQVEDAVTAALAGSSSIATAVIGVGNPSDDATIFDPTFLSRLASKGGVAAPGCDPAWANGSAPGTSCHLQVTPGEKTADALQQEIATAIDSIAGSLASCELTLDKTSPIDPAKVNVLYVDGAGAESQIPQDATNGWSYDDPADPSKVILHGQSCDTLKADVNGKVNIVIGCPTGTSVVN